MDMSKALLLKKLGCFALSSLAVFTQFNAQASDSLSDGKLNIGIEVAYPPFESYEGDKVVGFDPELAELLASKMGSTVAYQDTKFTNLILGLKSNKFDMVISGMYIIPDRLKQADALPYAKTGALILTLKDAEVKPKTENELCGLNVGLQQGTTWVKALNELSKNHCVANGQEEITIQEFPTAPEVSQALMSRNIDAQVEIAGAAHMFVERSRGRIEISSPDLVYPQTMGMYVSKNNPELKTKLEQAMAEIKADGSYQTLIEKYELTPVTN
jgi:polar amino acid transport system substrate-binding protein